MPANLNVWGLGFMQNRLRGLVSQGELAEPIARRLIQLLRGEQLRLLGKAAPAITPEPVTPAPAAAFTPPPVIRAELEPVLAPAALSQDVAGGEPPTRPPIPTSAGPLDAALSGPNLLLYLGAFLIAVSGVMLVAITPDELSAQLRMLLGLGGTAGFLAAGVALYPSERVRPAASTFLVLGAVLVPLDVWSIGTTVLDPDGAVRRHLLFAGSSLSAVLYGVLAQRGYGGHYVYLMALALVGAAEGSVISLDLSDPWHGVPHLVMAMAVLITAGSSWVAGAATRMGLGRLVEAAEIYAAAALSFFSVSLVDLKLHEPTIAAGAAFAALARARVHPSRADVWAWVACIAAVIVAIDLAFEIGPATPRVGVLLLVALLFWIGPALSTSLHWARVPGTAAGWLATSAALYVGLTSGPEARSIALFGASVRLWYDAWSNELRSPAGTARPYLAAALFASYVLWISALQTVGVLPAELERGAPALAWATLPASLVTWLAAVGRGRLVPAWAGELRMAAHVFAALAVVLMLGDPERPARYQPGFAAVGPELGALVAVLALSYAVGVRERRFPESLPVAIALGAAAAAGAVETVIPAPNSWTVMTAGLVGSIAMASLRAIPRSLRSATRIGGIAAFGVGLTVDALYQFDPHGHNFGEAIMVVLAAIASAHILPQVAVGHRWTVSAVLTVLAYAYARTVSGQNLVDPQLWLAPFVLILALPGLVAIMRGEPLDVEITELLFVAATATSIAIAVAVGPAVALPMVVAAAVGALLLAGIAIRLGDQAIAGAPVALAALTSHALLRYAGWSDMLLQGLVYGAVAIACARFLAVRTLNVDGQTVRGLYALGVALLTLPAVARSVRPDGWFAVAYLSVLAGALLTAAVRLRRDALGILGSVVALIAVLGGLFQSAVAETLIYTTTVGAYLVGLGLYLARSGELAHFATRDLLGLIRWSGALFVLIPWVLRSWEGAEYGVGFFILFALVLAGGVLLRQRSMLGAAAAAAGLEAIWVMTTVGRLLPFWMLFGIVGTTLLAIGTVLVFRRDLLDEAQRRLREKWDLAE